MLKHSDLTAPSQPRHAASAGSAAPQLMPLRADHLPQAIGLSSALAWPYREADWRFAFDLGAGLAVEVEGQLVGTALWWLQGDSHASVGMIIVSAAVQGKGIGRALMDSVLQHTGERTLILNSTQEGLALYTRLGFVAHGQLHQHQAVLEQASHFVPDDLHLRSMQPCDEQAVRQLDRVATGRDRSALLSHLFDIGSILVVDRGAGVLAYGCVREWGRGVVIGPVIASGPEAVPDAKALIGALAHAHRGRFVRIDVTDSSRLSNWLTELGLPCVGYATPMVRTTHSPPNSAETDARLFALSNQSIG
ncbi:GNAT family N-acetyltransferase [Pseudomonas tremae]|uniref:GNAT family N-acetyltransferase n=1 Tax=Pseudomonas syringae group TaxID=136849 RepID=UPI000F00C313|nr:MULTISPECIES: GNAT family N-acetyltransferase [Pseudomonas syringae group]MCQ3014197.1 GNAT family N-acetyltransferase [Pseudomonas tremae]QGL57225.1 GNAT family N-acetyltransferase [Pseudomonas coronafaciens pv. oryzae str. 1_6]